MFLILQINSYSDRTSLKMRIKTGLFVGLCSLFLAGLTACVGGAEEQEFITSTDAQIVSFSLSHDSIPALAKMRFTIDQARSAVYNHDSLPYLTDLAKFPRVKVTYTSGSGASFIVIGDSTGIASGDSINILDVKEFRLYAPSDNDRPKVYALSVNVHQVDPDFVLYSHVGSFDFLAHMDNKAFWINNICYLFTSPLFSISAMQLHVSQDNMEQWESISMEGLPDSPEALKNLQANENGFYTAIDGELYVAVWKNETNSISKWQKITTEFPITTVLGYLETTIYNERPLREGGLALIVEKDGTKVFAFTKDFTEFNYGEMVPDDFPLVDVSVLNNRSTPLNKITLVGDESIYATEDGFHWVKLNSNPQGNLPEIQGGTAFLYNDEIWFFGGRTDEVTYNEEVFYSLDGGLVWKTKESKAQAPEGFPYHNGATIVTDKESKSFYIIGVGGKNRSDIWKGVLNSRLF